MKVLLLEKGGHDQSKFYIANENGFKIALFIYPKNKDSIIQSWEFRKEGKRIRTAVHEDAEKTLLL